MDKKFTALGYRGYDGSKWICGSLAFDSNGKAYIGNLNSKGWTPVKKNTIGRYTGQVDIAGRRIYEYDIIKCHAPADEESRVVEWYNEEGSWKLRMLPNGDYVDPYYFGDFMDTEPWEIVGKVVNGKEEYPG